MSYEDWLEAYEFGISPEDKIRNEHWEAWLRVSEIYGGYEGN